MVNIFLDIMLISRSLVSICCITYNHEKYIRQCLDGFLMQKTDFLFEVIIHDDASTDKTADIIHEYEAKYPDIIKPIYQKENQYSKGIEICGTYVYPKAQGKYIALCEGDDYWTDPLKLQKQVDFLEEHQEYILAHSDCNILKQRTGRIVVDANRRYIKNISSLNVFEDILSGLYVIRTGSVIVKRDKLLEAYKESLSIVTSSHFKMGDTPLWLELSRLGQFYYFPYAMTVYRLRAGSACHPIDDEEYYQFQVSIYELRLYYLNKYHVTNIMLIDKVRRLYVENLYRLHYFNKNYKSPDFINTSFLCTYKFCLLRKIIVRIRLYAHSLFT